MGIRELFRGYPRAAGVIAFGVAAVSVGAVVHQLRQPGGPRPASGRAYFTTDDGASWFLDAASNPSPFTKDGKQAYRVVLYTCGGGAPFPSHLERNVDPVVRAGPQQDNAPARPGSARIVDVKDPRTPDGRWFRQSSPEGLKITTPQCPDGSTGDLEPVEPP